VASRSPNLIFPTVERIHKMRHKIIKLFFVVNLENTYKAGEMDVQKEPEEQFPFLELVAPRSLKSYGIRFTRTKTFRVFRYEEDKNQ
jgi:hypothetical protein